MFSTQVAGNASPRSRQAKSRDRLERSTVGFHPLLFLQNFSPQPGPTGTETRRRFYFFPAERHRGSFIRRLRSVQTGRTTWFSNTKASPSTETMDADKRPEFLDGERMGEFLIFLICFCWFDGLFLKVCALFISEPCEEEAEVKAQEEEEEESSTGVNGQQCTETRMCEHTQTHTFHTLSVRRQKQGLVFIWSGLSETLC